MTQSQLRPRSEKSLIFNKHYKAVRLSGQSDRDFRLALHNADLLNGIANNNIPMMLNAIYAGANIELIEEKITGGMRVIHSLARSGENESLKGIEYLINNGVNLESEGPGKWTALHYVCDRRYAPGESTYYARSIMLRLIDAGAHILVWDDALRTPLDVAAHAGLGGVLQDVVESHGATKKSLTRKFAV